MSDTQWVVRKFLDDLDRIDVRETNPPIAILEPVRRRLQHRSFRGEQVGCRGKFGDRLFIGSEGFVALNNKVLYLSRLDQSK
jgi:hypothetical protein